jgi:hypothetical protein
MVDHFGDLITLGLQQAGQGARQKIDLLRRFRPDKLPSPKLVPAIAAAFFQRGGYVNFSWSNFLIISLRSLSWSAEGRLQKTVVQHRREGELADTSAEGVIATCSRLPAVHLPANFRLTLDRSTRSRLVFSCCSAA